MAGIGTNIFGGGSVNASTGTSSSPTITWSTPKAGRSWMSRARPTIS